MLLLPLSIDIEGRIHILFDLVHGLLCKPLLLGNHRSFKFGLFPLKGFRVQRLHHFDREQQREVSQHQLVCLLDRSWELHVELGVCLDDLGSHSDDLPFVRKYKVSE